MLNEAKVKMTEAKVKMNEVKLIEVELKLALYSDCCMEIFPNIALCMDCRTKPNCDTTFGTLGTFWSIDPVFS